MTPEVEAKAMKLALTHRIERCRRGVKECRAYATFFRDLRWSREAADWQDAMNQAQARLDAMEAR